MYYIYLLFKVWIDYDKYQPRKDGEYLVYTKSGISNAYFASKYGWASNFSGDEVYYWKNIGNLPTIK